MKKLLSWLVVLVVIVSMVVTMSLIGCKKEAAPAEEEAAAPAEEEAAPAEKEEAAPAEEEAEAPAEEGGYTIALLVKNIGNPFFDAIKKGWDEACKELGDESVFRGPEQPTVEGQIEIMESLIAQKVDGITYVANDPASLVPVCKKAMEAGIPLVGWESGIVPDSRDLSVLPASSQSIGADEVKIMAKLIDYKGQIAILSATSTMANQNTWIEYKS